MTKAESVMGLEQEQLRCIAAALHPAFHGVAVIGLDLRFQSVNPALCRMARCERPEDMIGREVAAFLTEETVLRLGERVEAVLSGGCVGFDGTGRAADGKLVPIEVGASALRDDDGQPQAFVAIVRDISERRRAEEALRASREMQSAVIENVGVGIALISPQMEILELNRTMREWFPQADSARKPICYRTFNDPRRDNTCANCPTVKTLQDGQVHEGITDIPAANTVRNYRIVSTAIRDAVGNVVAAVAMVEDITERKRAEETLRESEMKYHLLFDSLNDAAFLADAQTGAILDANKQAEALLGRTRDEIIGMHQSELHAPGQAQTYREKFERHVHAGHMADYDAEVARKDGSLVPVVISAATTEIAGRQLLLGVFHDITERRRAEEALRQSEGRLRTLIETLPQRIFRKDRDSVYVWCNDNYAGDLGISAGEICGKTDYEFYPVELAEKYRADDRRVMDSAVTEDIEERYIQDGKERWVQTVKTPVADGNGNTVGVLGIFWDITDRRRAEQALEAKHRELESFVYTVSHDLRAPLISLEGFARLLADEYSERLDAEGQDYLRRLRANVSTMHTLLTDLLELSRVARTEEPKSAVAVGEVVAEVLDNLAAIITESGAKVKAADDMPTVSYSRLRLFQVFANLISNAIKFSREGEVPQVEIGWQALTDGYRFFVKDNGIGIPERHKDRVFDIFSRLKQKNVEGTGVGLAIVKRIVETHGGQVGIESVPGEGSTFWFTVPEQAGRD